MKTLTAFLLQCCFTTFADGLTTTNKDATPMLSKNNPTTIVARAPTSSASRQQAIKMDGVKSPKIATNQPAILERLPLTIKKSSRDDFWKTGRFYLPKGVELGFTLKPETPPYPLDFGGGAQFEISFPLERTGRKK